MPLDSPALTRRAFRAAWPCLTAAVFVLAMVAWRYDAETGLTRLLRFGEQLNDRRLPELADAPLHTYPGVGYDGQYYAQLAIDPDVRRPEVQAMMDYPRYRPRRILLSALVHGLTGGGADPWITIHVYALANLVVWLALGFVLWRRVHAHGRAGVFVWLACMLSLGALDSVRMALTDLPATFLIVLAIVASERSRRWPAVAALAAAALTRDTAVLAAAAPEPGDVRNPRTWRRHAANAAIIAAPLALWSLWIFVAVPHGPITGSQQHFDWPGAALLQQLGTCSREILSGNFDSRYLFGGIAVFSFGWQAVYVLWQARHLTALAQSPWLRVAAPYALFYFVMGDAVWHGYWAVARTCLPLTFAFNLLLLEKRPRHFALQLIAGNFCLWHGVYRLLPELS